MIPVYYIGSHSQSHQINPVLGMIIFSVLGNLLLNVLLPAYFIVFIKQSSLSDLGITHKYLKTSLLISLMLALLSCHQLFCITRHHPATYHPFNFNALSLWEPFFVYGWLLLCFDRAFGAIPAILLTAVCFLAYHIGSYPINQMSVLSIAAILIGVLFRSTKNLLIIYPFFWAASSSVGTLQGQVTLTQHDCLRYLLL